MPCGDCWEGEKENSQGRRIPGQSLPLVVEHAQGFKARCPELFADLVECAAFVNWRRVEAGEPPVLALALYA